MHACRLTLRCRAGFTLVEFLVVLSLLAIMAGVSGVALRHREQTSKDMPRTLLHDARAEAIRTGRAVTRVFADSSGVHAFTAFPDGSVVADSVMHVDYVDGGPSNATP